MSSMQTTYKSCGQSCAMKKAFAAPNNPKSPNNFILINIMTVKQNHDQK